MARYMVPVGHRKRERGGRTNGKRTEMKKNRTSATNFVCKKESMVLLDYVFGKLGK